MEKYSRTIQTQVELRNLEDDSESNIIEGYALKFDTRSNPLGLGTKFIETLSKRCLDNTDMSNVVATFNHDQSQVLGRSGVNLDLEVDDVGLRFKVDLPNTTVANDVKEMVRSGIISQCSFAFDLKEDGSADTWTKSEEKGIDYERTIRSIDHLYDVSVVTTPAYSDTSVDARALERAIEKPKELERLQKRDEILRKLKIQEIKEAIQ
ncbi:HK97 family phage prohead protease [Lactobacillus terrae]|uniref:HK97 family phage prohead protease n=1 Tax=Lactobacillus terrae TaxID=2269374 RepID=UPI000C1B6E61|nr:HK97 family phage prohead protease [Lactobacillus terrae]